jgi:peptidoglycan/LPS O-acetylase OafA/YrhL
MRRIAGLDGVRGIAVLMVVFFHTTHLSGLCLVDEIVWRATRGLWIGVELFFVLSGYLITGILLDSKGSSHYFRNFYARRALRIFPLYYAVIAAYIFILLLLPSVQQFGLKPLPLGGLYYWFYVSNWWFQQHQVLGVTWSLAIEEQFYLFWPLAVYLLNRRGLVIMCAINIAIATTFRILVYVANWQFIPWTATFLYLDMLSFGALLASELRNDCVFLTAWVKWWLAAIACVGLLAVVAVERGPLGAGFAILGHLLAGILFGLLIAVAATGSGPGWLLRLASAPILRTFGKYSYAIYLFHTTIDATVRRGLFGATTSGSVPMMFKVGSTQLVSQALYWCFISFFTLGAAWISWNVFEKHFLKLKGRFRYYEEPTGARQAAGLRDQGA